jgi:hypothetical protein
MGGIMNLVGRIVFLSSLCCLVSCAHTQGASGPKSDKSDSSYTLETAKVVEVLQAFDGKYKNVSYVVVWNGSRVSVEDPLSRSAYHEGETIKFMAQRIHFRRGEREVQTLSFTLVDANAVQGS